MTFLAVGCELQPLEWVTYSPAAPVAAAGLDRVVNMTVSPPPGAAADTVVLPPMYWLPLGLVCLALPLYWFNPWVGGPILVLGLFLGFQTATVRLHFTVTALELYRGQTQIRCFPYADWLNWEIFWSPIPLLFYFREVNSIHFTPMLFDPKTLRTCLEQRFPKEQAK